MSEPIKWYPSKVDPWIGCVLAIAPIATTIAGIALISSGKSVLLGLAIPLFVAILYGGLVFPLRYGIGETDLITRSGLMRTRVSLERIIDVEPTSNPLSSPALSLDRLRIRFGQGIFDQVMISPREKEDFLRELANRAGLRRTGDRLSRV